MVAFASALDRPHDPVVAWLRKLGPSMTSSERTFDHCVSPLPTATATTGSCIHRKSQEAIHPPPFRKGKRGNLKGPSRAVLAWESARPGVRRVGWVSLGRRTSRRAQGRAGEKVRAVGDQSSPAPKRHERACKDHWYD
jgi:hypothetical protein